MVFHSRGVPPPPPPPPAAPPLLGPHDRVNEHTVAVVSLERYHCDGVFIHPVVGPKKAGDFTGDIVMRAYAAAVEHHYPGDRVLLAGFPSYSRYAGPREAVF